MRKSDVLESVNFIYNGLKRKDFSVLQWIERSYNIGDTDFKLVVHTHFGTYTIDTMHCIALYHDTERKLTIAYLEGRVNSLIRAGFAFANSRR